jgi:hypothetical protein
MINIKDLTLEQIAELKCLFENITSKGCNEMVGTYSIIRTYSAGVWFGKVLQKEGGEIILGEARRLYYWKTANKGISLSEVANAGLDNSSKVCEAVEKVWLQPIEIIPCTDVAIENIKSQKSYVVR